MKGNRTYWRSIVAVVGLVLGLMLPAAMASAQGSAQTEVLSLKGKMAFAGFESFDLSGCVRTSVFIIAGDLARQNPPGGPQEVRFVSLLIFQVDRCTDTILHDVSGGSLAVGVQVSPDLRSARVVANQVPVFDRITGTLSYVDLNVEWKGTANVVRPAAPTHFVEPGMSVDITTTGYTRDAIATGTISNGMTNLIPTPSSHAEIQEALSGQVTITRSP